MLHVFSCPQKPEESFGSPRDGVTCDYEAPNMGYGNQTHIHTMQEKYILNCRVISPVLYFLI